MLVAEAELHKGIVPLLRGKSGRAAVTVGARATLRVLPALAWILLEDGRIGSLRDAKSETVLSVFRNTSAAWVSCRFERYDVIAPLQVGTSVFAAHDAVSAVRNAVEASVAACTVGRPAEVLKFAATAVDMSTFAAEYAAIAEAQSAGTFGLLQAAQAGSARGRAIRAAADDANAIEFESPTITSLADMPLWTSETPSWVHHHWGVLRSAMFAAGEDWDVWIDLYEARLRGGPANEALEVARVMIPEKIWKQGPKVVNAHIKELMRQHEIGATEIDTALPVTPIRGSKTPVVPVQRRAAVEPVWSKGQLTLSKRPGKVDLDRKKFVAALSALRVELSNLAAAVDGEKNIDKRPARFFEELADRIPSKVLKQEELFRLGHAEEVLRRFETVVSQEWPDFLAGRYRALLLLFDRTLRQSPTWREFKRNAAKETLNLDQTASSIELAALAANALREEEAKEFVDSVIPESIDQLSKVARGDADSVPSAVDAGLELLAADIVESVNNVLKPIAEAALSFVQDYAVEMGRGFRREAKKQAKKDGERAFKWLRRLVLTSAGGTGTFAAFSTLIVKYPEAFGWLEHVLRFIK